MKKRHEQNSGTVRKVRDREGNVTGYRALLPRELSTPPAGCKNPDRYQEPIGPTFFGESGETEARTLLDAAIVELTERRRPTFGQGLTFSWYVKQEIQARQHQARRKYENDARANKAVSTWRSIERCWLVDADWRDMPPRVITPDDVQRFVTWLTDEAEGSSGEPLSGDFVRNVVRLVRASFDRALVKPNPARDLTLPPKGKPKVRYLELAAQRRLFGTEADKISLPDRVMTGCGMGSGLRVGELLSMTPAGVRLDDADPHLWVEFGGQHGSPTKSGKARRVELFEPGLGFWRLWMEDHYAGGPLVFAGPAGGYQKHWPERFPDWAEHAGVQRLSSHIMRHSYAVAMLSGSWGYEPRSLEFVSQQLGHAELSTTQRFYGAFEAGTWQREVQRMTGRVVALDPREAVTARALLGLDEAVASAADASNGGPQVDSAANGLDGVFPRRLPQTAIPSRESQKATESDAFTHQTSGLALETLRLIEAGDERAVDAARALAESVLAQPATKLALSVAAGGPFTLTRAVELARRVLDAEPVDDADSSRAGGGS